MYYARKILPVLCHEKKKPTQIKLWILHGILVWCEIGASSWSHVGYFCCTKQITGRGLLRKDTCWKCCLSYSWFSDWSETVLTIIMTNYALNLQFECVKFIPGFYTDYQSFIIMNGVTLIRVSVDPEPWMWSGNTPWMGCQCITGQHVHTHTVHSFTPRV